MKGGFAHYMLKEIFDEPDAINNTIMPRITNDKINLDDDNIHIEDFSNIKHIHVIEFKYRRAAQMVDGR